MRRLTFIVGLPGSGKTHLARQLAELGGVVVDDISVDTDAKLGSDAEHLIVTDPNACTRRPEVVLAKLRRWFGDREITTLAFSNDPDQCWKNITARNDGRDISRAYVDALSERYDPSLWDEVIPVYFG